MDNDDKILGWLYGLSVHGIKLGLTNTTELLNRLGNPQNSFRKIHVAGTDGKGSTCAMMASILKESGFKTGLYTSPHIIEFNERISINGENISDEDVRTLVSVIMPIVEDMRKGGMQCTFFEVVTAMAFLYFRENDIDYAVVEVGMGGRFDATNVIVPDVSVITTISMEHTEYLGDTIEKIAAEKAGIIKERVPVITNNEGTAYDVIFKKALEKGAQLFKVPDPQSITVTQDSTTFTYKGNEYKLGIPGKYQADNACLAIEAMSQMSFSAKVIPHIGDGLAKTKWPCRMQKLKDLPIILDVTHTKVGSKALAENIAKVYGKVTIVFGVLSDKDISGIAENLSSIASKIIITKPISERSADLKVVKKAVKEKIADVTVEKDIYKAFDMGMEMRGDEMLLITGSFIMAEDALKWLKRTSAGF